MYSIKFTTHERHGFVIEVIRDENGTIISPFAAVQMVSKEKRLQQEAGLKKIRFLLEGQVLNIKQLEHWANEEYKVLPKCDSCAQILNEQFYTHRLSDMHRFCSQVCADQEFVEETEKLKELEEIDYL